MQVYVYRFTVAPGAESRFESAWHVLTELIYKERGSLGSRLHLSSKNEYIAYAQWPSFEVARATHSRSPEFQGAFDELLACLTLTEVLFELDVIDDLLRSL